MNGHSKPRRASAGRSFPLTALLSMLLAFLLIATGALMAGCGQDNDDDGTSSTVAASSTTTSSTTISSAPSTTSSTAASAVEAAFPVTVTDDAGNAVTIPAKPVRIVSTAPANTETLFALGAGDRVVGVNSLDDYPPEVAGIAKIGDYTANTEAIVALSPDLVVGYSGNEEALAPLQQGGVPVLIMNPIDLEGIYTNIAVIGAATGTAEAAEELVTGLKARIEEISAAAASGGDSPKVFYALDNTLWTCGPDSFVDELLALAQCTNIGSIPAADGTAPQAYYQFAPEQLVAADPDIILLPGSVFTSVGEFTSDTRFAGLKAVTEGAVFVIDDIVVTRPGPRIADGLEILVEAIHPGAF